MKTKMIVSIAISVVLATSCSSSSDKCVTFTPENVKTTVESIDTSLFTSNERALMKQYFISYVMMHPTKDLEGNPFAEVFQAKLKEEGFKDCTNLCEVLEYQRQKIKDAGVTEDEYVNSINESFNKLDAALE